jgi:phage baseplate assembly protein W
MNEMLGIGFAFPLGVDSRGRLELVGGVVDVEQSIGVILSTAPGERPMRPEFGCAVHDYVFDQVDAETTRRIEDAVREALDRWEPRIEVEEVEFGTDTPGLLLISLEYRLKATNDKRNLVYPFYVIPAEGAT